MNSSIEGWKNQISATKRGVSGSKRRPHQPAVLLWMVERASESNSRLISWLEAKSQLALAIKTRGGGGSPENPVSVLLYRGVIDSVPPLDASIPLAPASRMSLNKLNPSIGLPAEIWEILLASPENKDQVIRWLERQFD
jgi:hypothetical protein